MQDAVSAIGDSHSLVADANGRNKSSSTMSTEEQDIRDMVITCRRAGSSESPSWMLWKF